MTRNTIITFLENNPKEKWLEFFNKYVKDWYPDYCDINNGKDVDIYYINKESLNINFSCGFNIGDLVTHKKYGGYYIVLCLPELDINNIINKDHIFHILDHGTVLEVLGLNKNYINGYMIGNNPYIEEEESTYIQYEKINNIDIINKSFLYYLKDAVVTNDNIKKEKISKFIENNLNKEISLFDIINLEEY